ncbi:hypothetical protein BJY04DRAFT_192880 [Aspergillus karnatakaensis]|uniref:uncharacterized protein n=1 Tax=Aspergillus karnatakaensis TaxID=1810916 RepID=UPI003CCD58F0
MPLLLSCSPGVLTHLHVQSCFVACRTGRQPLALPLCHQLLVHANLSCPYLLTLLCLSPRNQIPAGGGGSGTPELQGALPPTPTCPECPSIAPKACLFV